MGVEPTEHITVEVVDGLVGDGVVQARCAVDALHLLGVESEPRDPEGREEVHQAIGILKRCRGQNGDDARREPRVLQPSQSADGRCACRLTAPASAVCVMDRRRSVDADTNIDLMLSEEGGPSLVDERPVGLKVLSDRPISEVRSGEDLEPPRVGGPRDGEGFACVPEHL
ncbi:MAG TPA: hypothetical protein VK507_20630 [Iamia sp.]|nr:hypothetical protein [Iamia sp.]